MGNNLDIYYPPMRNPFTGTQYYYRCQSTQYSGAFADVTVPTTANFPPGGSPTDYFVELPMVIDTSDLAGARPMLVYNVTDTTLMTRVSGSPGVNEYRVPLSSEDWRNVIEVNSAQASDVLGYDYYGIKSIINQERANYVYNELFKSGGAVTIESTISGDMTFTGNPDFQDSFAAGRKITGSLVDTDVTENEIFDQLTSLIPNVNDAVLINGSAVNDESGANTVRSYYVFAYALKYSSTRIHLYCQRYMVEYSGNQIVSANGENNITGCDDGNGTILFDELTLVW